MSEYRAERANLVGKEERRSWAEEYRFEEDKATGDYILEGYAATYEPYDCHGGPNAGGWIEQLDTRAFDSTLAAQPDVQLLINHTGEPLARTKSGTLKLSRDSHGLKVWARLDKSDPDVQRLAPKMRRKDMDEMSFAFRVSDQDWDSNYVHRTIRSLNLEKGDVSVVNYGMNPTTQAALNEAVSALSHLSNKELVELRKMDLDPHILRRAAQALTQISGPSSTPMGGVYAQEQPSRADDGKKPYGDVKYADPGYKTDGKKRYPLDTAAHVRAAWSYINMPKNQKGYTSGQVASIKSKIKAAAKELGVEISDGDGDSKSMRSLSDVAYIERGTVAVLKDGSKVVLPSESRELSPADTHAVVYGDEATTDPVPPNIVGGSFNGTPKGESRPDTENIDPHEQALQEEMLAMDAYDDPYTGGTQVEDVAGDHPNGGDSPQGGVPPNVVTSGAELGGGGGGIDLGSGPVLEPGEPNEELDAAIEARENDPADEVDQEPGGEAPSDGAIDLGMADALDRTIIHCYKIAGDNMELRKGLAAARRQLKMLRGVTPSEENSDINRKLSELRAEVGDVGSGTVSDGLAFLRSAGSAPVGFRGGLAADPEAHVITPHERLLKEQLLEARAKEEAARRANTEADRAAARVKAAQREAELNDAIRRHAARKAI